MNKTIYLLGIWAFLLIPGIIMAQPAPEAPTTGDGTASNPYQIGSVENLLWIHAPDDETDPSLETRLSAYYRQTADIVFLTDETNGIQQWDDGKGWTPIAGGGTTHLFTGQYDGQNFTIENLYINRPGTSNVGLFGHIGRGTAENMVVIRNVELLNVEKVRGGRGTGALAGRVTGDIYTLIEFCSASQSGKATTTVMGDAAVGGLVGSNNSWRESPGGTDNPVIAQSYANISVEYSGADPGGLNAEKFGGLAGCNQKGTIMDSYALGSVTVIKPDDAGWTVQNAGGLVGCILFRGRVERSFSKGAVSASAGVENFGGLIGNTGTGGNAGQAEDSYWNTETSGQTESAGNVTGLNNTEWANRENFAGFDFDNVWDWDEATGEPLLRAVQPTVYNIWNGSVSADWEVITNWSESRIPASTDFVIIPELNGIYHYPEIIEAVSVTVRTLNINPGAKITIKAGGAFTVNGSLRSETNGIFIESSDAGTGNLINNSERVGATVDHYVPISRGTTWTKDYTGPTEWFYISHPAGTQTITTVLSEAGLDGNTNQYDLYRWDEASYTWLNQQAGNGGFAHTHFERGTGYLFAAPMNVTFTYLGELHAGDQQWEDLTQSGSGGNDGAGGNYTTGWHLLGNPFPSGIVRTNWTYSNIVQTPKIWDVAAQAYIDVSEDELIPANTAFFVQVDKDQDNQLIIPFSARAHEIPAIRKSGSHNRIMLVAQAEDSEMRQQHVIRLEPDAAEGFDLRYDSRFMAGYAPQLFGITETDRLSTIAIPEITDDLIIPMVFKKNGEGNNFVISLETTIPGTDTYLYDLKTEICHKLTQENPYRFQADNGDSPERFELRFSPMGEPTAVDRAALDQHDVRIYVNDQTLYLEFGEPVNGAQLELYDLAGRVRLDKILVSGSGFNIPLMLPAGMYIVRITDGNKYTTQKVGVY